MVVVVGRAAHRIRERGAEVAGDRSDSHLFFVGFFFLFFSPSLPPLGWVWGGVSCSIAVRAPVRPVASRLGVASRRSFFFFFFFLVALAT